MEELLAERETNTITVPNTIGMYLGRLEMTAMVQSI
jgi:hypothetical protein